MKASDQIKTVNAHIKELNAKIRQSAERDLAEGINGFGVCRCALCDHKRGKRG